MLKRLKKYHADRRIYVLDLDTEAKKKSTRISLFCIAAALISQVLAGMVNQDSSHVFWVVFPYIAMFLPLAYAVLGWITYRGAGSRMSSEQYHEGIVRIRKSLLAVFVLSLLGIALGILYMIIYRSTADLMLELYYLALHLPQIGAVIVYGRYYDKTFANIIIET